MAGRPTQGSAPREGHSGTRRDLSGVAPAAVARGQMKQVSHGCRSRGTLMSRRYFSVRDFGAVGDGVSDDTEAFRQASIAALGLGRVAVQGDRNVAAEATPALDPRSRGADLDAVPQMRPDGLSPQSEGGSVGPNPDGLRLPALRRHSDTPGSEGEYRPGYRLRMDHPQSTESLLQTFRRVTRGGLRTRRAKRSRLGAPWQGDALSEDGLR